MCYNVWRFQNEYGCSILINVCFPPESCYLIIALAVEIQWHVVGGPSKRVNVGQHSRAITAIRVVGATFRSFTFMPQMSTMGDKGGEPINNKGNRWWRGSNTP